MLALASKKLIHQGTEVTTPGRASEERKHLGASSPGPMCWVFHHGWNSEGPTQFHAGSGAIRELTYKLF